MGRGRTTNRPAEIVGVAGELFARRGYGSVSLEEIADAIGAGTSAVFYHYRRKQQILADVVGPLLDGADKLMIEHRGDPAAMFEAYVDLMIEYRVAAQVISSDVASVMTTDLGDRIRTQYDAVVDAMAGGKTSARARARAAGAMAVARLAVGRTFADLTDAAIRREVVRVGQRALFEHACTD